MKKQLQFPIKLIVLFVLVLSSCSKDDPAPPPPVLVEATKILNRSSSELQTFLGASSLDIDVSKLRYEVDIYKVKYKTHYKDNEITASGLVILPKTTDQVGMLSFQHGTISANAEAPTSLPINSTELILYAALGSSGFITVVPDFIGFGESKNVLHPYYVEEATATAIIDNLKAARELGEQKAVKFNKKLFLAGYSQGGYATMATHKSIETNGLDGFNLIASFPASGGYDIKGMQEYFFKQQTYTQPFYIAYVAMSYQSYYGWTGAITDFFKEPYASRIPSLFNGSNNSNTINAQLTNHIPDLVNADLLGHINTDPKYSYMVTAFNDNSLLDWTPTIKMYMYHGDADTTVPYENSVSTYNYFINHGTSADVVSFTTLYGADHGSGVIPYVESFIKIADGLK
jgi:pimeloyl-ACP methyl ester carboxylesterase